MICRFCCECFEVSTSSKKVDMDCLLVDTHIKIVLHGNAKVESNSLFEKLDGRHNGYLVPRQNFNRSECENR